MAPVQSRLTPSVAHYNAAMKRFFAGKPHYYKRVSKVSLSKFHAAIQHLERIGVKFDRIESLEHLLCVEDLALAVTRCASPAAIVKHTHALFIVADLKKAHEDIAALKDQHSAQLVLKQQVIENLEAEVDDNKKWLVIEYNRRRNAEAWQDKAEEELAEKIRLIGELEGKIAKAEAQGKQVAHLYWARAIKEKNALLEDKDAFIRKLEATVADTNNKWLKEMLKRDEFEAAAKKMLHDNAVLVEEAVAMPVAPLPITPDFVPVAPPPSPIDMPMDFKFAMTA